MSGLARALSVRGDWLAARMPCALVRGVRALVAVAAAGLAIFHLQLFIDDIAGGHLADPGLALRWLAAGVLVAALVALGRSASLTHSRGIAAWLLVVLLHAPAVSGRDPRADAAPVPAEALATLLQTAAAATGLVLIFAGSLGRRRWYTPAVTAWAAVAISGSPRLSVSFAQPLAPRPPPD